MWVRAMLAGVLVAVAGLLPLACGGDEDAEPLQLEQRLPTADDAPGFAEVRTFDWREPEGPVDEGFAFTQDFPETRDEALETLRDGGYVRGVASVRSRAENDNLVVMVLQLGSEDAARETMDALYAFEQKRCVEACNVRVSEFDLDGIDGGRGIEKVVGAPIAGQESPPFDRYVMLFADGPFLYLVERAAPPGSIERDEAIDAAATLHERVEGAPPAED